MFHAFAGVLAEHAPAELQPHGYAATTLPALDAVVSPGAAAVTGAHRAAGRPCGQGFPRPSRVDRPLDGATNVQGAAAADTRHGVPAPGAGPRIAHRPRTAGSGGRRRRPHLAGRLNPFARWTTAGMAGRPDPLAARHAGLGGAGTSRRARDGGSLAARPNRWPPDPPRTAAQSVAQLAGRTGRSASDRPRDGGDTARTAGPSATRRIGHCRSRCKPLRDRPGWRQLGPQCRTARPAGHGSASRCAAGWPKRPPRGWREDLSAPADRRPPDASGTAAVGANRCATARGRHAGPLAAGHGSGLCKPLTGRPCTVARGGWWHGADGQCGGHVRV